MAPRRTLILGSRGQLGRALRRDVPPRSAGRPRRARHQPTPQRSPPGRGTDYDVVLNAAGYTAVDDAESAAGRVLAWAVNAQAPAILASMASRHRFTLVHYSTDYVFDGTRRRARRGRDPVARSASTARARPRVTSPSRARPRTTCSGRPGWSASGKNFVRTMASLARAGVSPTVVDDQVGRLTFADELARATRHLLDVAGPVRHLQRTNAGPPTSWADVARRVFARVRPLPGGRPARHHRPSTPPARLSRPARPTASSTSPSWRRPGSRPATPSPRSPTTWPTHHDGC